MTDSNPALRWIRACRPSENAGAERGGLDEKLKRPRTLEETKDLEAVPRTLEKTKDLASAMPICGMLRQSGHSVRSRRLAAGRGSIKRCFLCGHGHHAFMSVMGQSLSLAPFMSPVQLYAAAAKLCLRASPETEVRQDSAPLVKLAQNRPFF